MGESEPRLSLWFVFETYYAGLPSPGSPLLLLTPQFLRRAAPSPPSNRPHVEAGMAGIQLSTIMVIIWSITEFRPFQLPQQIVCLSKLSETHLFVN